MNGCRFWVLLMLLIAGCGGSTAIVPVAGRVTLDGQPLAGAHVSFEPVASGSGVEAGSGSFARTDADGRYVLKLVDSDRTGATVGTHVVRITTALDVDPSSDDAGTQPERVPLPFRNGSHRFEVPAEGTASADFHMES